MYIESLSVKQFRCFEHAEMKFQYPGRRAAKGQKAPRLPNVNLLLGDNGSGKSAVLQSIALSVLAPILSSSGFRPYFMVRRVGDEPYPDLIKSGAESRADVQASLLLHEQDEHPPKTNWAAVSRKRLNSNVWVSLRQTTESIGGDWEGQQDSLDGIFSDEAPAFFIAAYGSNRRAERDESFDGSLRDRSRAPRYQRVASLFEDGASLVPMIAWLDRKVRGRAEEAGNLLNQVIHGSVDLEYAQRKAGVWFRVRGTSLPFLALSDGYRGFVGWVADLLYRMMQVVPLDHKLVDLRGIVVVDELDLLLHPEWQRTVIDRLATTFPNLQFFFTTHSPILAGAVEAANILVAEFDPEINAAVVRPGEERVHGLSADQILTSPYFGLGTSRAPGAEEQMHELRNRAWKGDASASVEFLRRLAEGFEEEAEAGSQSVGESSPTGERRKNGR